MSTIPVTKTMIPYNFDISLGSELYNLSLGYNAEADLFTVALKKNGVTVCAGAPLIYGRPLFEHMGPANRFPAVTVIPGDMSGKTTRITWDNFGEKVRLYVDDGEEALPWD